ncbi:hypothetical protein [Deinococcus wulumuqiensis]|uniref:hypothetical protein n=1 Tax=Deinococcus wulumuqiensis TaxID=980427 RepID=UPI002431558A|nr:hypothetical protein [Deinococcus wulumuqiensis]
MEWDTLSKKERRKLTEKAIKRRDADTLIDLTGVTLELEPFFPLTALQCPVEVQTLPDGCQFE